MFFPSIAGIIEAFKQGGIMLLVTMAIQLVFASQIEIVVPRFGEAVGVCRADYSIWWAGLTMYWFLMMDNLPQMIQSFILVFFSRYACFRAEALCVLVRKNRLILQVRDS